ncbi:MAG: PDZ domain-containing protein [Streptosporangiales bacterium]|nr:PDZ domain-containing protein [Streptosporangiales bacterium]
MTSPGYLRFPHIHGDLLAFVAEDDVWLAPAGGGRAWRLTADGAGASHPRFSRDGRLIAWTSKRDGDPEIYTAEVEGGPAVRRTWWGDRRTRTAGWTSSGEILAITAHGQPAAQNAGAWTVPLEAPPRRLPFGQVDDLAIEAGGTALLTARESREPAVWKGYRGGTAGRLWTAKGTATEGFRRILADLDTQLFAPMITGGRLAFLSDHEGTGNVYSCALDGTDLRRHTDHDGWYARNPSTDGTRIVYHVAGDIWILDSLEAEAPRKLDIDLAGPPVARAPRRITAADHLDDLDCDETGQASVVSVRGTVHWLTHDDGPARTLSVRPDARARLPRILAGDRVAWVTDADGDDALEIAPVGAPAESRRIASGEIGYVNALAAAPDGKTLAVAAHDGRLLLVDVASGTVTELAAGDDGEIDDVAWSPDSAWLAWAQPGPRPLARIRLAKLEDRSVIDVTDGRFADSDPVFTVDGLHLAFLSRRTFDPVYDAHTFDLSFPYGSRPYLVPLAAATLSPFGPRPGGRPAGGEDSKSKDSSERISVTVDAAGIGSRVVAVPVDEGRYYGLAAVKGGLVWLRSRLSGILGDGAADLESERPKPCLQRFDLRKREVTTLDTGISWFAVSGDGARLVIKDGSELRVVPADRKAENGSSDDAVTVDTERARFTADPAALWAHAYEEAGRQMRRNFWTPGMSGVEWDAVLDRYRPLLARVGTSAEFADLLLEVVGELGTSHSYVMPGGAFGAQSRVLGEQAALLGADVSRAPDGRWLVDRVLPGESSDPLARSPLSAPGVAVFEGDEITEVGGQPVDPDLGPWPLLAGTAGKPVELTVVPADPSRVPKPLPEPEDSEDSEDSEGAEDKDSAEGKDGDDSKSGSEPDSGDSARRVVVVPLSDERRLRYQDMVVARRRFVRERSGGRLGYLHVPDMMGEGWAHLHRDLHAEMSRDALILDVRGNRGGHTSQLIVEKLARRIIGWDSARWVKPESYPADAPRGPLVALADEFAGSDGDIVTAAIRTLGLGPVIGARTWGGVIGIDGYRDLVDGTYMTVPGYSFWFSSYGWNVENYGVDPDTEVLITPDDWAAGRDPQLETAVDRALSLLEEHPPATPPDPSTGPSRRRPPLPPR